jgi:putative membrane protein
MMAVLSTILLTVSVNAQADSAADLNDLEIAHVAYTADVIDIRYAHLALAISTNPAVHAFAQTMIRDHAAVNDKALALVTKLNVAPQDNFLSRQLNVQADQLIDEMSQLRGEAFDRRYAENELGYHKAVNGLVEGTFIPNIENAEVKALFEQALAIFKAHEKHAEMMVAELEKQGS